MMDTIVPSSRKKEKARRVTVELYVEGQHPDKRHGAEPQRQDAYRTRTLTQVQHSKYTNFPAIQGEQPTICQLYE